jgi:hypothetical protein
VPSTHSYINERLLSEAGKSNALWVHPHAQRTGGKTLRDRVLAAVLGPEQIYGRTTVPLAKRWPQLTESDLEHYRAVSDHFDFRPRRFSRPVLPVALLRHPLYRAASLHRFVQKSKGHVLQALARDHDMEEFYRRGRDRMPRYFRNLQCRSICGIDDAQIALETIMAHYLGVGFTEHVSRFAAGLGGALGWPALDVRVMVPDAERYGAITPGLREMVLEDNGQDLALFDAMANGPPYRIARRGTIGRTTLKKAENAARGFASRYL